jgi:hypothetical protein
MIFELPLQLCCVEENEADDDPASVLGPDLHGLFGGDREYSSSDKADEPNRNSLS